MPIKITSEYMYIQNHYGSHDIGDARSICVCVCMCVCVCACVRACACNLLLDFNGFCKYPLVRILSISKPSAAISTFSFSLD